MRIASISRRQLSRLIEPLESRQYFSVDLTDSVSFTAPVSKQLKPGGVATIAVDVTNAGTTKAAGVLAFAVSVSPNADGSTPILSKPFSKKINIAGGASKVFGFKVKIPLGTTPDPYFAAATIDPSNAFAETSVTNNSAVSIGALTVLSPFPNLLGTWSGTLKITKGYDKRDVLKRVDVFTSENDVTGAFTGTATNYFANGAVQAVFDFSGTIATNGVFSDTAIAQPEDAAGITHAKGKLTGHTLKSTFINSIDSGIITLTFQG